MSDKISIKILEALRDGNHKAFETVFITYYNKTKVFIFGYLKSESDAEELAEDLFVSLWENRRNIDTAKLFNKYKINVVSSLFIMLNSLFLQRKGHERN